MNAIKELRGIKDWVCKQTTHSEKDTYIFNNIVWFLKGIIDDMENELAIKAFFNKLNIDCLVLVSQYHSWADGDEDGVYGGVNHDLMPELKCLGINTENNTASEISLSDDEKKMIEIRWNKIVGKPDNSCWGGDGWCDYNWDFLFIENDNINVASGELSWGEGRSLDKDDVPFLPNKEIQFGYTNKEFCVGDEFLKTKFWKSIVDCASKTLLATK